MKSGATTVFDKYLNVVEGIKLLAHTRVMVGVPAVKTNRKDEGPITNAALAYIHENGAPEANIPARPFLKPGINNVKSEIQAALRKAGELALTHQPAAVERQLNRVGLIAVGSVKAEISSNIPPPLALRTVLGRIARRKSKAWRAKRRTTVNANMAAGLAPQTGLFVSLIDTGQLRTAITYVLRKF